MRTKTVIFAIILFNLLLVSCNRTTIKSIHVLFYGGTFESTIPTDCDNMKEGISPSKALAAMKENPFEYFLNSEPILDTTITNPIVLFEIAKELKNLQSEPANFPVDARISCTIKYKNGKEEKLCIGGGYHWVNAIDYCGVRQKQNNHLLYLIKQNIGYYSWMSDRVLEYSEELQDNSFKRDSVVGRSGRGF